MAMHNAHGKKLILLFAIIYESLTIQLSNNFASKRSELAFSTILSKARFVGDINYSKLGAVSWVQNCPPYVNGKSWFILNQSLTISIRLQMRRTYLALQIGITDVDR